MRQLACLIVSLFCALSPVAALADMEVLWKQEIRATSVLDATFGDVDGDGDVDVVMSDLDSPSPLLLNDGNGFFAPDTGNVFPPSGTVELGDLDGDGDLDLFIGGFFNPCQVWLNDGAGSFAAHGAAFGGNESRIGMALVDVDGDDDLDAVLPTEDSSLPNQIWLNDGSATFTDSGQSLGMNFSRDVVAGDVDGDDDVDLVFAVNGRCEVWLNDGVGVFSLSTASTFSVLSTFGLAMEDLDGDSDLDLFLASGSNPPFTQADTVWLNDGNGVFTSNGQSLGSDYSFSVALFDIDFDGDRDAIVGTNNTMPNRVYLNNGAGHFTLAGNGLGIGSAIQIGVEDFDGDGDRDVFLAVNNGPSEVWRHLAAGPFLADTQQRLGGVRASSVAAGDLDGDGDLDAVIGGVGALTRFLFNDGSGQMADQKNPLPNGFGNNNGKVSLGDFDGDGDLDLLVPNGEQGGAADLLDRIWENNGNGVFSLAATLPYAEPGNASATGDFDGDGDLDFIIGNGQYSQYTGGNRLYLNDGVNSFVDSLALGEGNTQDLGVGDFDGDGDLDVFVANANEANTVWLNNGSAVFTNSGQSLGTSRTVDCLVVDVDGDDDLDVVCANSGQSNVLWLNNGSGVFTDSGVSVGSGNAVAAFDADGDLDLDLWVGQRNASNDLIYLNDGAGLFTLGQTMMDVPTEGLVAGDFSGDGIDDILSASGEGNHSVWVRDDLGGTSLASYLGSFGLSGDDLLPGADPDGDGLANFAEMAYNLDPSVADANVVENSNMTVSGTPLVTVEFVDGKRFLRARFVRRQNDVRFQYRFNLGPDLESMIPRASSVTTTQSINADYERVQVNFPVPTGSTRFFGQVSVTYVP